MPRPGAWLEAATRPLSARLKYYGTMAQRSAAACGAPSITCSDIRYVRMGTRDLEAAVQFATKIVGLVNSPPRTANAAYFRSDKVEVRGDTRDHTLRLFRGRSGRPHHRLRSERPGRSRRGRRRARERRLPGASRHQGGMRAAPRQGLHRVQDPTGNKIEIVARPYHSGVRYFPGRDAGITGFSHIGLYTHRRRSATSGSGPAVCNARVSDWLGDSPFLRIDTVASFGRAVPDADAAGVQHINHQVEDIDDVMQLLLFPRRTGVKIVYGPGRHPISTRDDGLFRRAGRHASSNTRSA